MNEENKSASKDASHSSKPRRHPLFGRLKGAFTVDPDWDLTKPAMPEWADMIDEKHPSELPRTER